MKIYSIHLRSGAAEPGREAVAVKEGFCWPAALFGPAWALARGMWFAAPGIAAIWIGLALLLSVLNPDPVTALALVGAAAVLIGYAANDWRRAGLSARGWCMDGLACGDDRDAAMRRFFDLHPDAGR